MALGARPKTGLLLLPDQPFFAKYEYWIPQRRPPFGPWKNLYQKPSVPSSIRRVSPAQLPPLEGVVTGLSPPTIVPPTVLFGAASVGHPLLLAKGEPYPPMPLFLMVVVVVPGIAVLVGLAGIAAVFNTLMLWYPVYDPCAP